MVSEAIHQRYIRDPLPVRLGGLAADLARIGAWADNPKNREAVGSLLEESKFFAEWAATPAPLETQAALAEVQVSLALWHRRWLAGQPDPGMPEQSRRWSERLLELSGFV